MFGVFGNLESSYNLPFVTLMTASGYLKMCKQVMWFQTDVCNAIL